VKGQVVNLARFKPNRTIVEICSPNAKDTDLSRGREVTVFDAQQCNDGKFETDGLAPGKYIAIVSGYNAWTHATNVLIQSNATALRRQCRIHDSADRRPATLNQSKSLYETRWRKRTDHAVSPAANCGDLTRSRLPG
jgi:hypothetical protein